MFFSIAFWQTSRSCVLAKSFQGSTAFWRLSFIASWFSTGALDIIQRLKSIILSHSSTQNQVCLIGSGALISQLQTLSFQESSSVFTVQVFPILSDSFLVSSGVTLGVSILSEYSWIRESNAQPVTTSQVQVCSTLESVHQESISTERIEKNNKYSVTKETLNGSAKGIDIARKINKTFPDLVPAISGLLKELL